MIKTVGNKIAIELIEEKEVITKSGLALGDTKDEQAFKKGTVVHTGMEVKEIVKGDVVYFNWSEAVIDKEGKEYHVVREPEIIGVER